MSSDAAKQYLATNAALLAAIDAAFDGKDHDDPEWHAKVRANARKPNKWKRVAKYNVGSAIDREGGEDGGGREYFRAKKHAGGVVREFVLVDGDGVRYAVIEVNGAIVHHDNVGD